MLSTYGNFDANYAAKEYFYVKNFNFCYVYKLKFIFEHFINSETDN